MQIVYPFNKVNVLDNYHIRLDYSLHNEYPSVYYLQACANIAYCICYQHTCTYSSQEYLCFVLVKHKTTYVALLYLVGPMGYAPITYWLKANCYF